ncbi:chorion class B protein PC10-like isoform X2 [Nymphalis io]|uniref:chorion class B protein PC10-like isoform X2 n=1 Tax=Inachis io TaxID=171585 RepID=UPI0021675DBC|nr:chorion class B protein PC10-like isoform X2 [Nymphalis io]
MQTKIVLLCFQAFLVQSIYCQCIGNIYNDGLGWDAAGLYGPTAWNAPLAAATWAAGPLATPCATEWAAGYAPATLAASNGGGLAVTSFSPISVTGVKMTSENAYEGGLAVTGTLPFLGAVALEGALPTAGTGDVRYGCGNGNVAMLSEDVTGYNTLAAPYGYGPGPEFGYSYGPLAYEAGVAGPYGYNGYRECEGC